MNIDKGCLKTNSSQTVSKNHYYKSCCNKYHISKTKVKVIRSKSHLEPNKLEIPVNILNI